MKKVFLIIILVAFSISSFAQRNNNEWLLSVGFNSINSLGTLSPFNSPGDWATKLPISAAIELNWTDDFAIEQSITFNGFTTEDRIDSSNNLTKDYNYVSFDTHVKYYFGKYIFNQRRTDWIDLYANAGLGFFSIDETNISANLGGGVLFWLNKDRSFGIRTQVIGKFAFNHKSSGIDNNHYQWHLQAIFKL